MLHSPLSSGRSKNRTIVRSKNSLRLARAALQAAYVLSEDLGTGLAERLFTSPRRFQRPERERALLATGRPFTIDVARHSPRWGGEPCRVAAWRWGHGPTVLLVHGWEGRGTQLGSFIEPLVEAGLSVVAFDAPGHGDSGGRRAYLTDMADAVVAVAAEIRPVHGIIAHSLGAAAVLLAHARGRVNAARNVMIAPNVLLDRSFLQFASELGLDEPDRRRFEHAIATATGLALETASVVHLASPRDAGLLVVHDRDDRESSFANAHDLATAWPGAQLHSTDGLGHRKILRDPTVIADTIEFVRHGVPAPASDLIRELDRYFADR